MGGGGKVYSPQIVEIHTDKQQWVAFTSETRTNSASEG